MLQQRLTLQRYVRSVPYHAQKITGQRSASLTSAIGKGVRRAGAALKKAESQRVKDGTLGFWELKDREKVERARTFDERRTEEERRLRWLRKDSEALLTDENSAPAIRSKRRTEIATPAVLRQDKETEEELRRNARLRAQGILTDSPTSIPYTEATSEFVYGTFAVFAALTANQRRFHKLYIDVGQDESQTAPNEDDMTRKVIAMARKHKVKVERIAGKRVRMLDRMAGNRPHNGLVLEANPIVQIPIKSLESWQPQSNKAKATLGPLSDEDKIALEIDPKQSVYSLVRKDAQRAPFMLWLDKITDTGNLGAILRTAFYLGVDAVILPSHGTAPISAVSVKASAGAAEMIRIFSISNELDFMTQSQQNGWKFFATAAPDQDSKVPKMNGSVSNAINSASPPSNIIQNHPCVLILGNEGEGLRSFLQRKADHLIAIEGTKSASDSGIVDSLNVSVAAALLIDRFLGAKTHTHTQRKFGDGFQVN